MFHLGKEDFLKLFVVESLIPRTCKCGDTNHGRAVVSVDGFLYKGLCVGRGGGGGGEGWCGRVLVGCAFVLLLGRRAAKRGGAVEVVERVFLVRGHFGHGSAPRGGGHGA